MLLQGEAPAEGLAADVADEGLFFAVGLLVRFQVGDLAKGSSAGLALVGLFSGVDADVLFWKKGVGKKI